MKRTFDYVLKNATSRNYLGKLPLPPYKNASIRRYFINGASYFILFSGNYPIAIWDINSRLLLNKAKRKESLERVKAFYTWIEDWTLNGIAPKEIRI